MNGIINAITPPPLMGYDHVIKTQEEFDAMISQSDWGGGHSVLLIGDGGTSTFNITTSCIIPDNITTLDGVGSATINLIAEDLHIGYASLPTKYDISASGLSVLAKTDNGPIQATGFTNMRNLTNCHVNMDIFRTGGTVYGYGFVNCHNLVNCRSNLDVVNADYGSTDALGFNKCESLVNCESYIGCYFRNPSGLAHFSVCFHECSKLVSCIAGATGNYGSTNYGYYNCNTLNGCRNGQVPPNSIFGGTNTGIDNSTCDS